MRAATLGGARAAVALRVEGRSFRADGRSRTAAWHRTQLGLRASSVLELNSGDMLVLVTDGFFEWANAQEESFGLQRMQNVIRISKDKTSRELISDLHQAVISFSGDTKQDDLTAVIIKRTSKKQTERAALSTESSPIVAVD
jgi:serine/threonine protein phosphatase PrpC